MQLLLLLMLMQVDSLQFQMEQLKLDCMIVNLWIMQKLMILLQLQGLVVKTLNADGTVNETLTLNTDYYLAPYNADKVDTNQCHLLK